MMAAQTDDALERASQVGLLLLDVDGVLTDGRIIYNHLGEETKQFHCKDGMGLRLLMDAGIQVGIVTGRKSPALLHRMDNLGITLIFDGIADKAAVLPTICDQTRMTAAQTAYVGDDLPDIPLMRLVGCAFAVADAAAPARKAAHAVAALPGGRGAVRQICEFILTAQQRWQTIVDRYNHGLK